MTVTPDTPDTSETPAVRAALEQARRRYAEDLPGLVRKAANRRELLAADESDVAFVERQLVELDAALAAAPAGGFPVMLLMSPIEATEFVYRFTGPAVVVLDGQGVPALLFRSDGSPAALTPRYGSPVTLATLAFPLMVVELR